jgi:hypothetical protein
MVSAAMRAACFLAAVAFYTSCGAQDVDVIYDVADGYEFSVSERRAIEAIATRAADDARDVLPAVPRQLVLRVTPRRNVIAETGESGTTGLPNILEWRVDPRRNEGVVRIAEVHLRPFVFYALHRVVRDTAVPAISLMDHVVAEGMATAFERDFAGARPPPWGAYPSEASEWAEQLMALPPGTPPSEWMTGPTSVPERRWMGIRAGVFLVDQAIRVSRKSSAELVTTATADIIRMALDR